MRLLLVPAFALLSASFAPAQAKEIDDAVKAKLATVKYVQSLRRPDGGYLPATPTMTGKPVSSLRATSAAARALKYNGAALAGPDREQTAAFVLSCYDPQSGGFADTPGGKPDVMVTSVGVMAAVEVGVPKEKFRKAMDYLRDNAKDFEQVRLAAAAVEAWGVKECPFELGSWIKASESVLGPAGGPKPWDAREVGSAVALAVRLGATLPPKEIEMVRYVIEQNQRNDGGWGKRGTTGSDLETTYRVMRAFHELKVKPKDVAKLREFVGKCRNADGGYGVTPGEKSNVGATYYASIVLHWLDEMEAE